MRKGDSKLVIMAFFAIAATLAVIFHKDLISLIFFQADIRGVASVAEEIVNIFIAASIGLCIGILIGN